MRAPLRLIAVAAAACCSTPLPASAAERSFVTFSPSADGPAYRPIPGGGDGRPYRSAIALESWSWGVTTPVVAGAASAGGGTPDGLRLVKRVDRWSPRLRRYLRTQTRIASARLSVRAAQAPGFAGRAPYVEHCLGDVRITGITTSYGGGDPPSQELIVTYGSTRRRYVVPASDGTPTRTVFTASWNVAPDLTGVPGQDAGYCSGRLAPRDASASTDTATAAMTP